MALTHLAPDTNVSWDARASGVELSPPPLPSAGRSWGAGETVSLK